MIIIIGFAPIALIAKTAGEIPHWECVCIDEDGVYPDGTYCMFYISNDFDIEGECIDGECIPQF